MEVLPTKSQQRTQTADNGKIQNRNIAYLMTTEKSTTTEKEDDKWIYMQLEKAFVNVSSLNHSKYLLGKKSASINKTTFHYSISYN